MLPGVELLLKSLPALLSTGLGIGKLLTGGASDEEKELAAALKKRMEEGASPQELRLLEEKYGSEISEAATTAQRQASAAFASLGSSYSSDAIGAVGGIRAKFGGMLPKIKADYDLGVRREAGRMYPQIMGDVAEQERERLSGGIGTIAMGLSHGAGQIYDFYKKPEPTILDWLEENKDLFKGSDMGSMLPLLLQSGEGDDFANPYPGGFPSLPELNYDPYGVY